MKKASFLFAIPIVVVFLLMFSSCDDIPNKYAVTFNANGGTLEGKETILVYKGQTVSEPAVPERESHIFIGWYIDKEATIKYDFSSPVTSDFILYAGWIFSSESSNPDSDDYDKLPANPSSDYRILSYIGDYDENGNEHLVLNTTLGIILYDYDSTANVKYRVIISPIARPLMLINEADDTYVKAALISSLTDNAKSNDKIYEAQIDIGNDIDIAISNVYMQSTQSGGTTSSIKYTVQQRQPVDTTPDNRNIVFYNFADSAVSATIDGDILKVSVSNAHKTAVQSTSEIAPYIVGDGYIAFLDENESYHDVYAMEGKDKINRGDTPIARGPEDEIVAFFGMAGDKKVLVDNSGSLYVDGSEQGDYGSFPMDNRRVAYSTIIEDYLYIGYKYGPEIITVNIKDGKTNSRDTSDINNETVVGIKQNGNYFYVITEESEVIRTQFN